MSSDARSVAIACQGGGSHTAFTAGVLARVFDDPLTEYEVTGFSGTSGGAITAAAAWDAFRSEGASAVPDRVRSLWAAIAAETPSEYATNEYGRWLTELEAMGAPVPSVSPYTNPAAWAGRAQLREYIERYVHFDPPDPGDPSLHVSSVDVLSGRFRTFDAGDLTPEVLLASAAAPRVFPAVDLAGVPHWDGLFARNPPVKPFLSAPDDVADKPDEIWVVRVNPDRRDEEPRTQAAIADRRDELAADVSLTEQREFVERVTDWVDEGWLPRSEYKPVTVETIQLTRELPLSSKVDRDPDLVWELYDHGWTTADAFLDERD